ncbi:TIR domain-containing protein [Planctomycetota bacterium]|nr:TIR domain-containing protein [Planctomycetota bacterium]
MRYPKIAKPTTELVRPTEDSVKLFKAAHTFGDVAELLEVHPGHLKRWLYKYPGHSGYKDFEIPKKNGKPRQISAPPKNISILQQKFKTILDAVYQPKDCVFGFVNKRSVVGGANIHKKQSRWVLNIDLEDFYTSIHFGRVRGLFMSFGAGENASTTLAHLVTKDGVLPQGACTSPVISNMIAFKLDRKLINIANKYNLKYSRYADDITFSYRYCTFPKHIAILDKYSGDDQEQHKEGQYKSGLEPENITLGPLLVHAITKSGFTINTNKNRLFSKRQRQEVTGLTVNEFTNVNRKFIRQIRAMIHAIRKFGPELAGIEYIEKYRAPYKNCEVNNHAEYFLNVLYGKLSFLRMVRGKTDVCYLDFCLSMSKIDPEPPTFIKEAVKMRQKFDLFIIHASEDKNEIATPLHEHLTKIGLNVFIDEKYIKIGDSFIEKINHALGQSKHIIAILSSHSVEKSWPKHELQAVLARHIASDGNGKIIPIMAGNKYEIQTILDKWPLLSDKRYHKWEGDPDAAAQEIADSIGTVIS